MARSRIYWCRTKLTETAAAQSTHHELSTTGAALVTNRPTTAANRSGRYGEAALGALGRTVFLAQVAYTLRPTKLKRLRRVSA